MIAWLRLSLRRLRDARAAALTLGLFVLATAFVTAAAPRALDAAADGAFRHELLDARSSARNIALQHEGRLPGWRDDPADPYAGTAAVAAALEGRFPPEVAALIDERAVMVTTPRFSPGVGGSSDQTMRLRFQPGAGEHVRIVSGRMPEAATPVAVGSPAVIEVALSPATASAFGAGVGSRRELRADRTDPLADSREARVIVEVTGLLEPLDPGDPFWYDDPTLWEPRTRSPNPDIIFADVIALAPPAAYPILMDATEDVALPMRTALRFTIDPDRLEVAQLDAITAGLRRMESVFPAGAAGADGGGATTGDTGTAAAGDDGGQVPTALRTELLGVLDAFAARWRAAQAVLGVMAVGVLAVAGAALALVALLLARRRRAAVGMWRWRGASRRQVDATLLTEGLLLTVPAALAGAAVAIAALPGGPDGASLVAAGLVAAIAVGALLLAIPAKLVGPPHEQAREGDLPRAASARRIAAEIVIVVLAVVGAVVIRDRGVGGTGAAGAAGVAGAAVADPFIAAVPMLLGVAVGLLALRLFRLPLRAVAAVAARRADLVPSLGLRRVTRGGTSGPVLLVLLATVSVAVFASVMLATLDAAASAAAWGRVGAPYLLSNGDEAMDPALHPETWPGVEATAGAWRSPVVIRQLGIQVGLVALDPEAWATVNAGTPVADALPPALLDPAARPVPVIVSRALAESATPVAVGDRFPLTVEGGAVDVEVVSVVDAFPSLPAGERFIVVSRPAIQAQDPSLLADTMQVWLRAPDAAAGDLDAAITARPDSPRLTGRAAVAAAIAASPVVRAVTAGLALTTLIAAIYAALAVAIALTLTGAARAIEVARLRALGLSRREALALDVVEHAPTVIVAFVVGVLLGAGTFLLLRDGLGIDAIVGWPTQVATAVDPVTLLGIFLGVTVIVAIGILAAARIAGRVSPAAALRRAAE